MCALILGFAIILAPKSSLFCIKHQTIVRHKQSLSFVLRAQNSFAGNFASTINNKVKRLADFRVDCLSEATRTQQSSPNRYERLGASSSNGTCRHPEMSAERARENYSGALWVPKSIAHRMALTIGLARKTACWRQWAGLPEAHAHSSGPSLAGAPKLSPDRWLIRFDVFVCST